MPKLDKNNLSKEQVKSLLAERKKQKILKKQRKNVSAITSDAINSEIEEKVNILCLKYGTKYSSIYVNTLYNMVARNLSIPFNFYCLTDDPSNLNACVTVLPLPKVKVVGWWFKPYIFSDLLPINGTILYLDLDVVITNQIDKLFSFSPGSYCIIRDFTRVMRPSWEKFNSSVIRFTKGSLDFVWKDFEKNYLTITRRHYGDQDYLFEKTRGMPEIYPDNWIRSWKWEVRKSRAFEPGTLKGFKTFATIENVTAPPDCCIAVFHGDPNPHLCKDPYIIEKWK